jgi:hypothetical protein
MGKLQTNRQLCIEVLRSMTPEHMVTSSIVSSLQGEPRSTHDVDVIVVIHSHHVDAPWTPGT